MGGGGSKAAPAPGDALSTRVETLEKNVDALAEYANISLAHGAAPGGADGNAAGPSSAVACKTTHDTAVTMVYFLEPSHCSRQGRLLGGVVCKWVDAAAAVAAWRLSENHAVTASMDDLHFARSAHLGELVIVNASVTRAWNTSMEVEVDVLIEDPCTGARRLCCRTFLSFVSFSGGRPTKLPPFAADNTEEDRRRWRAAQERKAQRIARAKMMKQMTLEQLKRANEEAAAELRAASHPSDDRVLSRAQAKAAGSMLFLRRDTSSAAAKKGTGKGGKGGGRGSMAQRVKRKQSVLRSRKRLRAPPRRHPSQSQTDDVGGVGAVGASPDDRDASQVLQTGRPVSDSYVEITEMVLPENTNPLGTAFGGQIMLWVVKAASIAAGQHCRSEVVIASIDDMHFLKPVKKGEIVVFAAQVNRAFTTSMEVGVRVMAQDPVNGVCALRPCCDAFLTFIAVDRDGRKRRVPPAVPGTDEERLRFEQCEQRRRLRVRPGKVEEEGEEEEGGGDGDAAN